MKIGSIWPISNTIRDNDMLQLSCKFGESMGWGGVCGVCVGVWGLGAAVPNVTHALIAIWRRAGWAPFSPLAHRRCIGPQYVDTCKLMCRRWLKKNQCFNLPWFDAPSLHCGGVAQRHPYNSCDFALCEVGYFLAAGGGVSCLARGSFH